MENKVREYREKRKLTQEELATKSGVNRATISKLENGEDVDIKKSTMQKLADALGVKVYRIFLI